MDIKNTAKKTLVTTKNFVVNHRLAIAVPATIIATALIIKKYNEGVTEEAIQFIDDMGLTSEFNEYLPNPTNNS
jgi:hypothetical protein